MARILVADDDRDVRDAIRDVLVAAGHTVEEADNGLAVLQRYAQDPAHLLVIDLYMPGVDGLETIIRVRAQRPDAKIVAISGGGFRDKHDVLTMARQAGASATLAKPLERAELLSVVSHLLGTAEPGSSPQSAPTVIPPATAARSWLGNFLQRVFRRRS